MKRVSRGIAAVLVSGVALLLAGSVLAQEKVTTTEKRPFEVISVDGNKVVYRTTGGKVMEATLPPDFKATLDNGQEIGLADAKPGMKGVAVITTTKTTVPVTVTEVKNGEVLAVAANNLIVRTEGQIKKYTVQDIKDRNVSIMREGERVELSQLRPGDRLTATIITRKPPVVMTEAQVKATVKSPEAAPATSSAAAAPAPAPAAAPQASSAPAAEPAPATKTAKKLPKTGSHLPLVGWLAVASLAVAFGLTMRRRSR